MNYIENKISTASLRASQPQPAFPLCYSDRNDLDISDGSHLMKSKAAFIEGVKKIFDPKNDEKYTYLILSIGNSFARPPEKDNIDDVISPGVFKFADDTEMTLKEFAAVLKEFKAPPDFQIAIKAETLENSPTYQKLQKLAQDIKFPVSINAARGGMFIFNPDVSKPKYDDKHFIDSAVGYKGGCGGIKEVKQ